ncbi:hypothetical protein IF1G_00162 [Cordyceps javanica]|uniref:Uncharacterized protein n=1 Tax=Cordyceps javanica TaxID=43265 RepID=A0A545VEU0_9HYPO|nr:hypothetical protein IF1G_00162 [Cordyceps javanica]
MVSNCFFDHAEAMNMISRVKDSEGDGYTVACRSEHGHKLESDAARRGRGSSCRGWGPKKSKCYETDGQKEAQNRSLPGVVMQLSS